MNFDYIADAVNKLKHQNDKLIYRCYPYFDHINQAYSLSDLVVCRAGATTLAEITALGKAAILVPYPYAVNYHQEKNAETLKNAGAASVIKDEKLNGETLFQEAKRIIFNDNLLKSMNGAARRFGRPNAAQKMVQLVFDIVQSED